MRSSTVTMSDMCHVHTQFQKKGYGTNSTESLDTTVFINIHLTPWAGRVFRGKESVPRYSRDLPNYMESEGLIPCLKETATCLFTNPNESSLRPFIPFLQYLF